MAEPADAADSKGGPIAGKAGSSEDSRGREDEQRPEETLGGQSAGNPDAIEAALGEALTRASAAGEWAVVAQLAKELEARRQARSATIDIASERAKREGKR